MSRKRGAPCLIDEQGKRVLLDKVYLGSGLHDENWLQGVIHERPEILPIGQIEPGFGDLIPVSREVSCGHGYIDNLLVTPGGDIVIVEAKLWRNPQARREVVAQALDYVSALSRMGYEAFEDAVTRAETHHSSLYGAVAEHPDVLDEPDFIDAVARNLTRGRILALVVGDGIRLEAENLSSLLQEHAGAHFTLALVELAAWQKAGTNELLIVPDVLAKTVMIERGIVRLADERLKVEMPETRKASGTGSISEERYFEELEKQIPEGPRLLRDFLDLVAPLGVEAEMLKTLNMKAELPGSERPTNFGYIQKSGKVWTDAFSWTAPERVAQKYNQRLAELIGGTVANYPGGSIYVASEGKSAPLLTDLLPQHGKEWANAMEVAIKEIHQAARDRQEELKD